jgi:hypothetical protein
MAATPHLLPETGARGMVRRQLTTRVGAEELRSGQAKGGDRPVRVEAVVVGGVLVFLELVPN